MLRVFKSLIKHLIVTPKSFTRFKVMIYDLYKGLLSANIIIRSLDRVPE